jgi:probable rRNA maturation factor
LGDVIICPQVLFDESKQFHKTLESHWALIVIHGILHLLGYDHIKDDDAVIMQAIEIKLLAELGVANPYDTEDNQLE